MSVGHSDLGGKVRVSFGEEKEKELLEHLCTLSRASESFGLLGALGVFGITNKRALLFSRELGELDAFGRRGLGLCWTPVDAPDRAGPATLGSHGGGATRRLGVTGS